MELDELALRVLITDCCPARQQRMDGPVILLAVSE
jgi:hypothetical protein